MCIRDRIAAGSLFQACDNSKTYAEMLEDEKNAVNKFIKDSAINVISLEAVSYTHLRCSERDASNIMHSGAKSNLSSFK